MRCIVSVGMLTEGWDCNTVTHIVGLRPFMSQLLCEQVVGRGLRRTSYDVDETGRFTEEVAKILGVPFEVIPYKATPTGPVKLPTRKHVHSVPEKTGYRLEFPRVEGYTRSVRNRVTVDWDATPALHLDPQKIPPEVAMKASLPDNEGRPSLSGPGREELVDLNPFRRGMREQQLAFQLAGDLTRSMADARGCQVPAHALFPQVLGIVQHYLKKKVLCYPPAERVDVYLSPYYGYAIEVLRDAIQPDAEAGEAPEVPIYDHRRALGSTDDVDFWTARDVRVVSHSHVNYVVADTKVWEQSAAYYIDTHPAVEAFVKNAGMGFTIPYIYNAQPHDYVPDFLIRLRSGVNLILETKGYDELEEIKEAAARRWVNAVNTDGRYGQWAYEIARHPTQVREVLEGAI